MSSVAVGTAARCRECVTREKPGVDLCGPISGCVVDAVHRGAPPPIPSGGQASRPGGAAEAGDDYIRALSEIAFPLLFPGACAALPLFW